MGNVFAWKGETLEEYWWCTEKALTWPSGQGPEQIVDDGGDSTLLLHEGKKFEDAHAKDGSLPDPASTDNAEFKCVLTTIKNSIATDKMRFNKWVGDMVGVSEETTTGVHRLISMAEKGTLLFPAINVNDCVTKSKFDNEIQMELLEKATKRLNIKPQVDKFIFPDGHGVIILAEGRLLNLGCATGHPSFVMSNSFTNQTLAQLEIRREYNEAGKDKTKSKYQNKVYLLPKELDEKVARLHLGQLGATLTVLSKDQADYIGVSIDGPYKPLTYRY